MSRVPRVQYHPYDFELYCTFVLSKVQNPEFKPGNVILFSGFVMTKVQNDNITFNVPWTRSPHFAVTRLIYILVFFSSKSLPSWLPVAFLVSSLRSPPQSIDNLFVVIILVLVHWVIIILYSFDQLLRSYDRSIAVLAFVVKFSTSSPIAIFVFDVKLSPSFLPSNQSSAIPLLLHI